MSGADEDGQAGGNKWGDDISPERQAELEVLFQRQAEWAAKAEAERGESAFKGVPLTGADVFWLAARTLAGTDEAQALGEQMERLRQAHPQMKSINLHALCLSGADLRRADLSWASLGGADLSRTPLARADMSRADLHGANLSGADLVQADLSRAFLNMADLSWARLDRADLSRATLPQVNLSRASLVQANLSGADLNGANLSGATLNHATFDPTTILNDVRMTDTPGRFTALIRRLRRQPAYGPVHVADLRWNGADLTVVDWSGVRKLGDEQGQRWWGRSRTWAEIATRANIQLSKQLDNAGLKDDSDRFAYRAQVCQRGVHLRRFRLGRWLFSWLLFIVAGYGYRPLRTLFWYLAVIGSFAFAYFQATHGLLTFGLPPSQIEPLPWYEALVLSVSSFHGRGFFQPVQSLGDPVAILAAIEAVFGLFIEVSFIATFTQRYFGK